MKKLTSKIRTTFCLINTFALLCGSLLLPLRALGQTPNHKGKPVVITFGQPNIWSLDQAHYLLSQLRERSLNFTAKDLTDLDPNEANGTRIDFMRQLFELVGEFKQPAPSASPAASPAATPAALPSGTPERVASADTLDGSVLSTLLADADLRKRLFSDPKLNAITRLDNHIQLQYEIISRQLTLLRDEVRPGERLVFLELPQSVYTTDDKADNKLAQVWWQVDGYNKYSPLEELQKWINLANDHVAKLMNEPGGSGLVEEEKSIRQKTRSRESLRRLYLANPKDENLGRKLTATEVVDMSAHSCNSDKLDDYCRAGGGEECRALQEHCSKYRQVSYWENSRDQLMRRKDEVQDEQDRSHVENLLQGGPGDVSEVRKRGEDRYQKVRAERAAADYDRTAVRTIDIIPHQSSLNVNDVQETVKSSFIAASFAFLFGLGARTSFQRQRDQFEQFLHQELYASGFGKGDSLFGWTFGPIPGTKRVAPGLRTTFAALVVPAQAESITLRATGCFFHREDNEPPDAMRQNEKSKWWDNNDRECSVPQTYLLPIPSGGGTRNFWVTGVEYLPNKSAGQRMTALIKGENFSTQVGVLVNGVPLKQVVELTRKLPASVRNDANLTCPGTCGEYEVVGPNDINVAFKMPDGFVGTPEMTVVGPGRSVTLNHLRPLTVRAYGKGVYNELEGNDTPFMFGEGPQVRIGDLRLFRDKGTFILGLLKGKGVLKGTETIFVNGDKLNPAASSALLLAGTGQAYFDPLRNLYMLRFSNPGAEKLDVAVTDGATIDTKTVTNPFEDVKKPTPLAVTEDEVLALDVAQGEMAVRLVGTGLAKVNLQVVSGADAVSEITSQSATEIILRLVRPRVAVKIKLTNPNTGEEVTRAIIRRPPRSIIERRDRTDEVSN